jgi:hypothetical protein
VADTLPGILAIFNNVASGREAEFEEWFQHEHLAERIAVPGARSGIGARGGDRKIEACLLVETLRVPEAEKIAGALAKEFPRTEIGVYRLLCEITAKGLR